MKVLRVAVLIALVVAGATACTKSGGGNTAEIAHLRAVAGLDRCPTTALSSPGDLPDQTLTCLGDGPSVAVSDLRGPLLVNVWGTWCGPCQREVPALQQVYADARGRLHILGVDTEDSTASALDFAAHAHMKYPSVVDPDGTFLHALGRSTTPMTFFIDTTGHVVHTKYGEFDGVTEIRDSVRTWLGVAV